MDTIGEEQLEITSQLAVKFGAGSNPAWVVYKRPARTHSHNCWLVEILYISSSLSVRGSLLGLLFSQYCYGAGFSRSLRLFAAAKQCQISLGFR